jgi:transposase
MHDIGQQRPHGMQPGFFDFDDLNDKLDQHNDPLAKINKLVDWAAFRPVLRHQVLPYLAKQAPCLIGMEACGGAHYWARELRNPVMMFG